MRGKLFKLLLVVSATAMSLLCVELILRALHPEETDGGRAQLFRSHATRGFEFVPNVATTRWGGIQWRINSEGYRDYEHTVAKKRFRILALGDSYFAGHEVSFEDSFLRRLEVATGVEVIKMAVSGYGTIQERLLWEEQGARYHPEIVLLGVYLGNDLQDNASFPNEYRVREGGLIAGGHGIFESRTAAVLARHSILAKLLLRGARDASNRLFGKRVETRAGTVAEANTVPIRYAQSVEILYRRDWPASIEKGFRLLEENVSILEEQVRRSGGTLVVIVIPLESQIYDRQWAAYVKDNSLDASKYDLFKITRRVTDALERNHIRYIDLLPLLREAAKSDDDLHPGHWHWSVKANALVAATVESYLRAHRLLPSH